MSKTQNRVAEIILDDALDHSLDYSIPRELGEIKVGMRVQVPLRSRTAKGTVLALKERSFFKNVKPLIKLLSKDSLISDDLFQLALWMSKYYVTPLSKVLRTLLPTVLRNEKSQHKIAKWVKPAVSQNELRDICVGLREKHSAQAKVLDCLLQNPKGMPLTEILEKASVSQSPISTLVKKKVLSMQEVQVERSPIFSHEFFPTKPKILNEEQVVALEKIKETLGTFQPHLIHGVTGSGKTEVYLQAIDRVLQKGQSAIYLVPEIALTSQTIERLKGRFGDKHIAILHHRLSQGERFDAWHQIKSGKADIIIGARSAIFCPTPNLGLIIVDEEHESSYKQSEETPKYHARDISVMRAKLSNCPVLLGSATPSLESYNNALNGKYQLITLNQRADNASLPKVHIVDMKTEFEKNKGYTLFSDPLIGAIKKRLELGEQTLLFLNRRGYHTSALCPKCSHVVSCPHCELSLTYHLGENILACHLCDFQRPPPRSCENCHEDGPPKFKGVGTQLVERSLHALFPEVRTLRLDADTTRHKGSHEQIFKKFRSGKADVLIGTQMIAKGLHFPMVTLVGVLGTDGSLNIPDFRGSENVFQLLTQVAGRSGRGSLLGEVYIQTHLPENETIQLAAKQDYEGYFAQEIEVRKMFEFPPFSHLIKCSFSSSNPEKCEKKATAFRNELIKQLPKNVEVHPVIACGYAKIKGSYRFQCLLKTNKAQTIVGRIDDLRKSFGNKDGVRLSIDVDPISTYF